MHGLKEKLESVGECKGHVLEYQARDPVRVRCFVVWGAAESFLQDCMGDASRYYRDGMFADG